MSYVVYTAGDLEIKRYHDAGGAWSLSRKCNASVSEEINHIDIEDLAYLAQRAVKHERKRG